MIHKPFSIPNTRGLKLAGIMTTPSNNAKKKYPVMILLHGFRGYKEELHLATLAENLTEHGIVPPAQTRKIFDAANEPKTILEFPEMDHYYKKNPEVLREVNQATTKFIMEYL